LRLLYGQHVARSTPRLLDIGYELDKGARDDTPRGDYQVAALPRRSSFFRDAAWKVDRDLASVEFVNGRQCR
jgi:hypothetical protein